MTLRVVAHQIRRDRRSVQEEDESVDDEDANAVKRDMCFFSDLGLLVSDSLVSFSESAVALTTRTSVVNHTSHAPKRDIGAQGLSSTWWCF